MRVFVAGATGAIGKRLVPLLVQAGHAVTGMTRSSNKADGLHSAGADVAIADLTLGIVAINGWNRLAIGFRAVPGPSITVL